MAGYLPAPVEVPPVLVGLDGAEPLSSADGPIVLDVGVGLAGRTDRAAQTLRLDGKTTGPPESLSVYHHTPGAGVIAKMTNPRPDSTAVVALIDANFIAAPTATAADHLKLKVSGQTSGMGELPLLGASQSLDNSTPIATAGHIAHNTAGVASYMSSSVKDGILGMAAGFRSTQTERVQAITFRIDAEAGSTINTVTGYWQNEGVGKRFELLDANLQPLVTWETSQAFADDEFVTIAFPAEIELTAGKVYYAAVMRTDVPPYGNGNSPTIRYGVRPCSGDGTGTNGGRRDDTLVADVNDGATGWTLLKMSTNAALKHGAGVRWADVGIPTVRPESMVTGAAGSANLPEGSASVESAEGRMAVGEWGATNPNLCAFQIKGSVGGFPVEGPITIELVTVGLGPSAAGQGLNVRVQIAAAT
jgi:hypothetical protein